MGVTLVAFSGVAVKITLRVGSGMVVGTAAEGMTVGASSFTDGWIVGEETLSFSVPHAEIVSESNRDTPSLNILLRGYFSISKPIMVQKE